MNNIKEAFQKVKQDIVSLRQEIDFIKLDMREIRKKMIEICDIIKQISQKTSDLDKKIIINPSTNESRIPATSTHLSTHELAIGASKTPNLAISTGNQGASTDRQTDRQTDKYPEKGTKNDKNTRNSIDSAAQILSSLDNIKKDIRLKFKRLTNQEILIFSMLYQINDEAGPVSYKDLAQKLNLTESSIRDYIGRLINKGIPVDKKRVNNKTIQLSVSENLKKIASLPTILQLRDI